MKLPTIDLGKFKIDGLTVEWHEPAFGDDHVELRTVLSARDIRTPGCPVLLRVMAVDVITRDRLEHFRDSGMLQRWIRDALARTITHELDEWLRVDGKQVVDSHPELKKK